MIRKLAMVAGAAAAAVALVAQPAAAGQGGHWFDEYGGGGNAWGTVVVDGTAVRAQSIFVKDTDCNSQWTSLQIYVEGSGTKRFTTAGYTCGQTVGPFNGPLGTLPHVNGEVSVRMCAQSGSCSGWRQLHP
ncbi:hypothetical protein [Yinghuangia soli]|uniref:Secreted protein n=1 Tax=Yinghuangia soli TaxID=2908204 RepID=A0AA41QAB8_9ACTN|nr:hypothetical protein [Yinghuangia soli]MCF2533112.1 hypothetical protein [Yinghuangia soli]